ncbi:MAG: chorismate mutase [Elusimicrobiales bacterium]|nr:chorismate mutase [Elusimicrobiales bacterium]
MNKSSINCLLKLRKKIDSIDNKIINLLLKRFNNVKKIGEIKKRNSIPIRDITREKEILQKCEKISEEYKKYLKKIYLEIINSSIKIQE